MSNSSDLNLVKMNGMQLAYIGNQTEAICLAAVTENPYAFRYVKNQTPAICLAAINKKYEHFIRYIDKKISNKLDLNNPDHKYFYDLGWRDGDLYNIHLELLKIHPKSLKYIKNQDELLCLTAVKADGWAIQYVKEKTPAICLAAVTQHDKALQLIKDIPDKLDLNNPKHQKLYDLGWRDGDLSRINLAAVTFSSSSIHYVKDQTPELCMMAVKDSPWNLMYIKEQTSDLCLAAISQVYTTIYYIKDLTLIADNISEESIQEGLNFKNPVIVEITNRIIKIRESNAIARKINVSESASIKKSKVKL